MTAIKHLPVTAAGRDIVGEIEANGAVIIDGFLAPEILAQFNAEIDPALESQPVNHAHPNEAVEFFHGPQTKHLTGVAGVSDCFVNEVLLHPIFKLVGDALLLPQCSEYLLNIAHVLDRGPGSGNQLIHRDQDVWPRELTRAINGHVQFASLIALGDYTAEMGATRLVPGSHQWVQGRDAGPEDIVVAEMTPGSAVIYLGSTLHGAGPNTTDRVRRGMHTSFCLGWLRTEENSYLSVPLERVRKMPHRAQLLLGYGVHDGIAKGEGFLGAVNNGIPAELMAAGKL